MKELICCTYIKPKTSNLWKTLLRKWKVTGLEKTFAKDILDKGLLKLNSKKTNNKTAKTKPEGLNRHLVYINDKHMRRCFTSHANLKQLDVTAHILQWPNSELKTPTSGKNMKQQELSVITPGNAEW